MSFTKKDAALLASAIVQALSEAGLVKTSRTKQHTPEDALRWGEGVEITRGLPPPRSAGGKLYKKLPFARMKVGDSFFVPDEEAGVTCRGTPRAIDVAFVSYLRVAFGTVSRHEVSYKITTRKADGGYRVWRIA